jgi:hypothetical protein
MINPYMYIKLNNFKLMLRMSYTYGINSLYKIQYFSTIFVLIHCIIDFFILTRG